jgi:hypothetical protein
MVTVELDAKVVIGLAREGEGGRRGGGGGGGGKLSAVFLSHLSTVGRATQMNPGQNDAVACASPP